MLSLVNDILDLSKIESGQRPMDMTDIDVREIFDDCQKIVKSATDCSQIYFETRVVPTMPSLRANERAIKQVILNLLFNAVKFTPGGGYVTLSAVFKDDAHILEVADTGSGIPVEDIPKITRPFAQLDHHPHIAKMGTGLGLAIAKALVDVHKGELEISSEVGKGTRVRIRFPRVAGF